MPTKEKMIAEERSIAPIHRDKRYRIPLRNVASLLVFFCVFSIAFVFALYTDHAWEDYYITFRASKNLATGHGLVFSEGQRIHSFTSPLGTLIPAALSLISGNNSDTFVLWTFRILNSILLGLTAVLCLRIVRVISYGLLAGLALIGMFALDAKIVDFSINGMETALMMFFLVAHLWVLLSPTRHPEAWLGIALGGLMWTRPDSFVYIVAISFGFFLFPSGSSLFAGSRINLLRVYLRAVILAAVIYLPWLLWTWHYYGSPIPHTVIAKGIGRALNFTHLAKALLFYPVGTIVLPRVFDELFLPPYALMGGWPFWLQIYSRALAWLFAFCWCIPRLSARIRALSFALMVASFYLDQIAPVPFPWYLPSCTLLAFFVFAGILEQLSCSLKKRSLSSALLSTAVVAILTISLSLTLSTAFQLRIQQREIETGLRKEIGLWLGRNAATRTDSVFLEPLGYIGYFSQLKMLDFPGLSSPEVVESRKRIGRDDIPLVIRDLHPDWIVLRPLEAKGIEQKDQELLSKAYTRVKVFDASKRISVYSWLPGRAYLIRDQTFYIYQRRQ